MSYRYSYEADSSAIFSTRKVAHHHCRFLEWTSFNYCQSVMKFLIVSCLKYVFSKDRRQIETNESPRYHGAVHPRDKQSEKPSQFIRKTHRWQWKVSASMESTTWTTQTNIPIVFRTPCLSLTVYCRGIQILLALLNNRVNAVSHLQTLKIVKSTHNIQTLSHPGFSNCTGISHIADQLSKFSNWDDSNHGDIPDKLKENQFFFTAGR
jgi:hypothetical protein